MSDNRLLSTDELLCSVVGKVAEIRAREYELMHDIAELERCGAASELGYKHLWQVLRHAVRWDSATARKWVTNAGLLSGAITPTGSEVDPKLPVTAKAVAEGALSIEHVAVVAEVMKDLPADEEQSVVDCAREHEPAVVREFGKNRAYELFQNDPEPRDPEPEPEGNQHVMRWKNGTLEIRAKLDAITGAKYQALLDPLAKPRPDTGEGPDPRSRAEREGDALAELIDLMLRADQLPEHGGEPVTLTLTMRYDDLAERVGHAMLDSQERVPAEQVRQLACNAGIIPLVLGANSQPMNIGRKTRTFPAGIRRILVARDRGCAFPVAADHPDNATATTSTIGRTAAKPRSIMPFCYVAASHARPPKRVGSENGERHTHILRARVARPEPQTETQPHPRRLTGGPTGSPAFDAACRGLAQISREAEPDRAMPTRETGNDRQSNNSTCPNRYRREAAMTLPELVRA